MQDIVTSIYQTISEDENYGEKFFITLGIIIIYLIAVKILQLIAHRVTRNEKTRYWIREKGSYILTMIAIVLSFYTWFNALEGLMAGISIIVGLSIIALKDLIMNIAGFFYIKMKKPFLVGDRIEIIDHVGDVIDVDLISFKLEEVGHWLHSTDHTGRTICIANSEIFTNSLANFSKNFPFIWKDIVVPITHQSNHQALEEFLLEIGTKQLRKLVQSEQAEEVGKKELHQLSRKIQLFDGSVLPKVGITVDGNGINVFLKFLCPYKEGGRYESELWRQIIEKVNGEEDLAFSPKAMRVVTSVAENKYV